MVIIFLSELQLGTTSEPSNKAIFLHILESSGQKSTLTTFCLLFFKVLNEENYRYILNQFSNNVITFLGTQFNVLSKSQTEQGLRLGLPGTSSSSIDSTTLGGSWSVQQLYSIPVCPLPSPSNQ